ncbi:hypothetical protein LZ31DRAFT_199724 [Colletotrichum somersetense]|nr:hypothetical protein LZ31DRAFT_199724 [Colletotrichum somersetense]
MLCVVMPLGHIRLAGSRCPELVAGVLSAVVSSGRAPAPCGNLSVVSASSGELGTCRQRARRTLGRFNTLINPGDWLVFVMHRPLCRTKLIFQWLVVFVPRPPAPPRCRRHCWAA